MTYGAGLRVSEVVPLRTGVTDSTRMLIRVEQGNGKDRNAMVSPQLLELLRQWWREGRRRGVTLPEGCLFPGMNSLEPLSKRQLCRAVHEAAETHDIKKRVSPHTEGAPDRSRVNPNPTCGLPESSPAEYCSGLVGAIASPRHQRRFGAIPKFTNWRWNIATLGDVRRTQPKRRCLGQYGRLRDDFMMDLTRLALLALAIVSSTALAEEKDKCLAVCEKVQEDCKTLQGSRLHEIACGLRSLKCIEQCRRRSG